MAQTVLPDPARSRGSYRCGRLAHRRARQPWRHAGVLRLRHLRRVCERHCPGGISGRRSDRVVDGVVRRVRRRLPGAADRRHRVESLRRSLRAPDGIPLVGVHHVRRHAGHGVGAVVCAVGRGRKRVDGGAALAPGFLPRRRAPRRADLRGRDRAAHRAVCLRRGVRLRDDGRGGGHRGELVGAHVPRSGAGAGVWMAHRVRARRPWRRAQFRAAAIARGIARVRAHEELRRAPAIPRAVAHEPGARGDRLRDSCRHRLLQRPVLFAPAGISFRRPAVRPAAGGDGANRRRDCVGASASS